MINVTKVQLGEYEKASVMEAIESGMLAQGKRVLDFEEGFAKVSGTKHVAATSNGTTALVLALRALGIGEGDEVITTPFTFAATLNAILETGATARIVDIEPDTYLIDASKIRDAINECTKAIMPVHLFGQPADMDPIMEIARQNNLRIVEDAAQAHGATYKGKAIGSFDVAAFSFYATKNLTTGEGGAVTTNDSKIDEEVRVLRNQGMRGRYEYIRLGYNYRMTDVQAAIGLGQLLSFEHYQTQRSSNALGLFERLSGIPQLQLPTVREDRTHAWHQFTIALSDDAAIERDVFVSELARLGVGSGVYYPMSLTEYPVYRENQRVKVEGDEIARKCAKKVVSLPVHPFLTSEELDAIASSCRSVLGLS
ncbi:MAG: DegT/DnrJ/EryC1/StrS family aminotransferase [Actinomycetota bacterium]|nr:DegT/DnrJ/EryC1/StrS family aminotransferase [Actinomycetota bacterium]